jgi:hypothetical protein
VPNARWRRVKEPIGRTLARNLAIAIVAGAVISAFGRGRLFGLPGMVLALWPSLGGHFVEIAFLDGIRPRLPGARPVQASVRLAWWLVGGALLGGAMIATAHALPICAPPSHWWWMGAPIFVGLELGVHAILALRGRPSFYRGDG